MVRLVTLPFCYQTLSLVTKWHSFNGPFGCQTKIHHLNTGYGNRMPNVKELYTKKLFLVPFATLYGPDG